MGPRVKPARSTGQPLPATPADNRNTAFDANPTERRQQSGARLRLMLGQIPAIIWTTDTELKVTSSLGAGLARVNFKPNQGVGTSIYDAVPNRDSSDPALAAHLRALKGESTAYVYEWQGATYQTRVEPLRDASGAIMGCIGLGLDISDLRRSEEALRQSEEQFRSLVEGVRDYAIFMLDPEGHILSWNVGAERITGYRPEEAAGKHFSMFYPAEDVRSGKPAYALKRAAAEGRFKAEGWCVRKDGSRFWADAVITALYDSAGKLRGFSKVTRDGTERKTVEEQLRDSEFRFRSITESARQAIITADGVGHICSWNPSAQILFDYTEKEALGKPLTMLIPERYKAEYTKGFARLRSTASRRILGRMIEINGLKKHGAEFPLEISLAEWQSGRESFYTAIINDITLRKKAEDSLRRLSGLLLRIQDEERRRMARELHDSTAQTLSALSLNLALVNQCADLASQPRLARALAESMNLADQASRELRTFSYLLHPPLLDEAGLADALRWYVGGFTQRTKIEVDLTISPPAWTRLEPDVEITLFRVAQEALTNVYRHSQSPTAEVRLALNPRQIVLQIADKGKGLPKGMSVLEEHSPTSLGVGIRGMRERVRQLGGRLELRSEAKGARVKVVLPHSGSANSPLPN